MDCLYCVKRKGMEIIYFNHANPVNVLCFGAKQMSDLVKRYGIERARRELKYMDDRSIWMISDCLEFREEARKEIADHDRTDTCSDIFNHISPLTKVIER